MRSSNCRPAFTLIDLAAVVVMGGVLVFALTAGVRQMQPRDNQVMCLANLHQIGAAIHAYAAEDPREQAIPIHMNMVGYNDANQPTGAGLDYWLWRCANWFAWGGQGATATFAAVSGAPPLGFLLNDANEVGGLPPGALIDLPAYKAEHRPLNGYLAPDPLTTFHCPSDVGYPDEPWVDDAPIANALRSCWDTLGNSYRASMPHFSVGGAGAPYGGAFSVGPWGHRLSSLPNPSRLYLIMDPLWGQIIGRDTGGPPDPNELPIMGWHGVLNADNLLYCDGSARLTSLGNDVHTLVRRPLGSDSIALDTPPDCIGSTQAGPSWQKDCYPIPGAVIWGDWTDTIQFYGNCWPWKNAYLNPSGGRFDASDLDGVPASDHSDLRISLEEGVIQ